MNLLREQFGRLSSACRWIQWIQKSVCDALLDGGAHLAQLGPDWPQLRQLCLKRQLTGNDLPDAWLAAATMHLGEHLVSFDCDFKRLLGRSQFTLLEPGTL